MVQRGLLHLGPGIRACPPIRTMVSFPGREATRLREFLFDELAGLRACMAGPLGHWCCAGNDQL